MQFFTFFLSILCSSTLFAFGISNEFLHFGSTILGFSGLTLLYYILLQCKSYKQGALLYAFHTVIVHLISSFWLAFFEDFAIFTLGGTTLAYFFFGLPFGITFIYALQKKTPLRIFTFASIWLMWEFFKSSDFLAYPWGTVPMFCFELKHFIQFIDTTGVWGLSFTVPLIAASFAEILNTYSKSSNFKIFLNKIKPFYKSFSLIFLLVFTFNIYGHITLNKNITPKKILNTVLVQQNSDPWDINNLEKYIKKAQELTKKTLALAPNKTDLIVWSESSLPYSYINDKQFYNSFPTDNSFANFLRECNTPILVGTPTINTNNEFFNSACLINPNGDVSALYSKMKLVAFAEYMPLSNNPIVKNIFEKLVGFSSGYTPGKDYTLFNIKNNLGENVNFTVPICFEDAFPDQCIALHNLGSELLINITNDSWSKTHSAEYQHFIVSYFRAIELRTTLIRSTNSGFSVVIDPFGNVLNKLPLFKSTAMFAKIPIYEHIQTPFSLFKNWLPSLIFIILITLIFSDWKKRIQKITAQAIPSCHWQNTKPQKKHIRNYKPLFSVKRKKRRAWSNEK